MTQKDGETYHVLGLEGSIPSKVLYYPKQSTDSMQPLSNYQWHFFFFTELEQFFFFTICMETQNTLNIQSNLKKEKQSWRNQTPYIRLYYKVKVTKLLLTEIQHSKSNHKHNEKITL